LSCREEEKRGKKDIFGLAEPGIELGGRSLKGGESGAYCLLGSFGVEGEGGACFKGGDEGTVLIIDHHAQKFSSKSENEVARGGGIFALESVQEAGVHF
jgi:hypothetical protein